MWKKTLYLLLFFCFVVVTTAIFKYVYRPHKDIQASETSYKVTATVLSSAFALDVEAASQKFLNKTIEVSGNITSIDNQSIVLNAVVICYFKEMNSDTNNDNMSLFTIKGRCIGYDELLEEIKLDQCSIINKN